MSDPSEIVADAMRRALDDLAEFSPTATLTAAVVILDVSTGDDDDDPDPAATHVLWKSSPRTLSTAHVHGLASVVASIIVQDYRSED
jgi:hypothetical protein